MGNYTTLIVFSFVILSSMATIGRCSWISGGAPPPVSTGDYVNLADAPASPSDDSASGPSGDFMLQGKENVTPDDDTFIIQGKIYCDPCRIQFPTKLSFPLGGTNIVLVCHKEGSDKETYRVEGQSDEKGMYTLTAVGDHAEEVCEITVSDSPDPNCPELMDDENHVRVSLTNKHGIKGKGRYANPLGFMAEVADPRCKEALDELGFTGI